MTSLCALILAIVASLPAAVTTAPEPLSTGNGARAGTQGWATWYDDGPGLYAAAGPALRHGDWRGSRVRVCATEGENDGQEAMYARPQGVGGRGLAMHVVSQVRRADPREVGRGLAVRPCVVVVLTDWCACGPRHGEPTLLDLSADAFRRLAPLSQGVVHVRIAGAIALPATDALP